MLWEHVDGVQFPAPRSGKNVLNMHKNFWQNLSAPFLALAPMAGVTDLAFRTMCKSFGADVIYTEFASANALVHGNEATRKMIAFQEAERPVVCQIFGNDPAMFAGAARVLEGMGFDGIDINFGCPAYKVVMHGGGVSLMRDLGLCYELVKATCEATSLPVSVKIRSSIRHSDCPLGKHATAAPAVGCAPPRARGSDVPSETMPASPAEGFPTANPRSQEKVTALDLVERLRDLPIAAIMIHGRSYEKPFDGEPDVAMIRRVKEMAACPVVANGGVYTPEAARDMLTATGADGIGIGRGSHGAPWIFHQVKEFLATGMYQSVDWDERKKAILRHAHLAFSQGGTHGLVEMRKHLAWYVKGIYNAGELRQMLVQTKSLGDVERALADIMM